LIRPLVGFIARTLCEKAGNNIFASENMQISHNQIKLKTMKSNSNLLKKLTLKILKSIF